MTPEKPDFSIAGEFVADVCTQSQLRALQSILPKRWSESQRAQFTNALHEQLQLRWSHGRMHLTTPPAFWSDKLRAIAARALTVQSDLVSLRATEQLYIELDGVLLGQHRNSLLSIETLFTDLWGNLEVLGRLTSAVAEEVGHDRTNKVTTHNAALLAKCLVLAHQAVFKRLPAYSTGTPFLELATGAAEALGLNSESDDPLRIGTDLLKRVVKS